MANSVAQDLDNQQSAEQLAATSLSPLDAALHSDRVSLHTSTVGVITAINGERASAQPVLRSLLMSGEEVLLPLVVDAPLYFPRGGGITMTFPVAVGDTCIILFAERALDYWLQYGGFQTPEFRLHDISDGMIMVGVRPNPTQLTDVSTVAAEIRTDDGLTKISVQNGTIRIQAAQIILTSESGSPKALVTADLITWITDQLIPALSSAGVSVDPPPPTSITTVVQGD